LLALEPGAHEPGVAVVVREAWVRAAQVDDRDPGEVVGLVEGAASVRVAKRPAVARQPFGRGPELLDREPADLLVQVGELGRRDRPVPKRREPVLDADV
jgi:hypothetical protein